MRRLLRYLVPHWWLVALAVLVLATASGLEIVGPWLTKVALDDAIPRVQEYAQRILTTWLGQRIMYDLRKEIFGKFQRLDLKYYDRNPVGRLLTRITSDVETLNELFSSGIVTVFGDVFTLAFIVAAMLRMDWGLALVAFSVLPFVAWAAFLFRARIREAYRDIRVRPATQRADGNQRFAARAVHWHPGGATLQQGRARRTSSS